MEAGDDIDLTFPIRLGLSLADYYQDKNTKEDSLFGYLEGGVDVTLPLSLFPDEYGDWYFRAGLRFVQIGAVPR